MRLSAIRINLYDQLAKYWDFFHIFPSVSRAILVFVLDLAFYLGIKIGLVFYIFYLYKNECSDT
jgi:hypothetical protein